MSLPRTVADVIREDVTLELECIDRVYLNVYQPRLQLAQDQPRLPAGRSRVSRGHVAQAGGQAACLRLALRRPDGARAVSLAAVVSFASLWFS